MNILMYIIIVTYLSSPIKNYFYSIYLIVYILTLLNGRAQNKSIKNKKTKLFKKNGHNQYYHVLRTLITYYRINKKNSFYNFKKIDVFYHQNYFKLLKKRHFQKKESKRNSKSKRRKKKHNIVVNEDNVNTKFDYTEEYISNINIYKYDASANDTIENNRPCKCGGIDHSRVTSDNCNFKGLTRDEIANVLNQYKTPKASNKRIRQIYEENSSNLNLKNQPLSSPKRSKKSNDSNFVIFFIQFRELIYKIQ